MWAFSVISFSFDHILPKMKRVKILALLLGIGFLALTSCVQAPCAAYTKADFEYQKDKKEHKAQP